MQRIVWLVGFALVLATCSGADSEGVSLGETSPSTLAPAVTEAPATPPSNTPVPTTHAPTVTSLSPPQAIAEPQPSCDGRGPIEGALESTAMAGIEDGSPDLPVSMSAGPCEGTWTTYTQEHGLPQCICELGVSPDGTAWVLSDFGHIFTFNGTAWTRLDTGTLPVKALDFGQDGTLWITTYEGVWAREAGVWIKKGDALGEDIAVAPDGSVWVYFDGALHQFDGSSWTEHALRGDSRPLTEGVGSAPHIGVAPDGTLWFAADSTLDSYDGTIWTSHSPASGFTPQGMTVGPSGNVWMVSASNPWFQGSDVRLNIPVLEEDGYGLVRYDGEAWVGYPIPSFADIAFASDGTIWVADTFIGAFRLDGQGWVHYAEEHGLADNRLELVAVAPDGTVWFGTSSTDVVRYQPGAAVIPSKLTGTVCPSPDPIGPELTQSLEPWIIELHGKVSRAVIDVNRFAEGVWAATSYEEGWADLEPIPSLVELLESDMKDLTAFSSSTLEEAGMTWVEPVGWQGWDEDNKLQAWIPEMIWAGSKYMVSDVLPSFLATTSFTEVASYWRSGAATSSPCGVVHGMVRSMNFLLEDATS